MGQSAGRQTSVSPARDRDLPPQVLEVVYRPGDTVIDYKSKTEWTLEDESSAGIWFVTKNKGSGTYTFHESEFYLKIFTERDVVEQSRDLADLYGTTDPEIRAVIADLKRDNPELYANLVADLISGDPELLELVREELMLLRDKSNLLIVVNGEQYWIPRAIYDRYEHVKSIVTDEGLDQNLSVNYREQLVTATVNS